MYNLCQLNELNLSCFGCCGHSYKTKREVQQDLKKNTIEYKHSRDTIVFRERADHKDLRTSGICKNLILIDNRILCPLHPELNNNMDLRIAHCDTEHICKTRKDFDKWSRAKQKKYIKFLKTKKLDSISYSIRTDNDALLKEFKQKHL